MKLYRNHDGLWVGTQAEAGNKTVLEVPVDKPGLLEWLNENARVSGDAPSEPVASTPDPDRGNGQPCPKCRLGYTGAERIANQMTVSAIADKILTLPGFAFSMLAQAVIDRMLELKKNVLEIEIPAIKTPADGESDTLSSTGDDAL